MGFTIGIPLLYSGLLCSGYYDGPNGPVVNCFDPGDVEQVQLMPQAVVWSSCYHGSLNKIVRMGTLTDPVRNYWIITNKPVMGSGLKEEDCK